MHEAYLLLFLLVSLVFTTAMSEESDCAARACLESPYGPGIAADCQAHIADLQKALVRGEGLPQCGAPTRDFQSPWYWRAMGWEECPLNHGDSKTPYGCGAYEHETLPELVEFEIGSDARLTAEGQTTLAAIAAKLGAEPDAKIRLIAVWESREGYADEALARKRGRVVREQLAVVVTSEEAIVLQAEARNWVSRRGLIHGVFVSRMGRDVRPDQTLLGRPPPLPPPCGLVEITPGSLKASVEEALSKCGYRLGRWLSSGDESIDFRETIHTARQTGQRVEDVLLFFENVYGLTSTISDIEVDFYALQ